jgi:hypothetical protein
MSATLRCPHCSRIVGVLAEACELLGFEDGIFLLPDSNTGKRGMKFCGPPGRPIFFVQNPPLKAAM